MDSKEFGLVFGQQLTGLEDLHYGYWDASLPEPSLLHLKAAQQRYTDQLTEAVEADTSGALRILDVGCGTGRMLAHLGRRGHRVDGVIPAPHLERRVRDTVAAEGLDSSVWGYTFEAVPDADLAGRYDVVLFSESFQYIPYRTALDKAATALVPGGRVVICDFFKTEHSGDGRPGDRSFGGGHRYSEFERHLADSDWRVLEDTDITAETSPTIDLVDQLLRQRIGPALGTLDTYLRGRHPWLLRLVKRLFRRKFAKLSYKYLSGYRSQAVFERYKTYRRIRLIRPGSS